MPDDPQSLPEEEPFGCCEEDSSRRLWLCMPRPLRPARCMFRLCPAPFNDYHRFRAPVSAPARRRHVTNARRSDRCSRQRSRRHPRHDPQHMRKPTTPCMEDADGIPVLLMALHDISSVNMKTQTLAVHKHDGHTKLHPPLLTPSFPNRRGLQLMPTPRLLYIPTHAYMQDSFSTPDLWTCPPLPSPSHSLTLRVTSDRRSEFKVDRRCNVPIPATLGWRSRASNDVALTFRHRLRSPDASDGRAPSLPAVAHSRIPH